MGENAKYFDVQDFNSWKRKQGKAYKIPPRANLLAAANHIKNLFDGKKINWAAFGGLAMLCLGARRDQPDLHFVYDDRDFQRIKIKLEADHRVRLPKGMNSLFPSKLLVATGPKFKDVGCSENVDVEVDLIPPGSHGTPPSDVLRKNQAMLRLNRDGGKVDNFKGLNMLGLVNTTIYYCKSQDLVWDPRLDVLFLCQNYGKEVESIRAQLNARQIQENFLGTPFVSRLSPEEQRRCYRVLLGKEPPPAMSLTPPAPLPGQRPAGPVTEPNTRPRIPSYKSSPALNSTSQQPSGFLTPPLPGQSKAMPAAPRSAPPSQTSAPHGPPPQALLTNPAGERDGRSQYRHTSAPNTPSVSRNVSPESNPANAHRPRSMDVRPPQQTAPSYKAQPVGLHNAAHVSRPQMVSGHAPTPMAALPVGMRPQKSMPDMSGRSTGTIPVFAHGQNSAPLAPRVPGVPTFQNASITNVPALSASKRTQPRGSPPAMAHDVRSQSVAKPSSATNNVQPISASQLQYDVTQLGGNNTTHGGSGGYQPPAAKGETESTARGLKVVGPGGLYPSPLKPTQQQQQQDKPAAPASAGQGGRPTLSSGFVFELDASSPQAASGPQLGATDGFIAELPTEANTSPASFRSETQQSFSYSDMRVSPPQGLANIASTRHGQYDVSPISPPPDHHRAPVPFPPPQLEQEARPSSSDAKSTAFDSLPPSLMIGSQGPRRRSPNSSFSQSSQQAFNPHTNVSKYQRYYSPPSSAPSSRQSSPKQLPVSGYKAYPGHSPPLQPVAAPAKLQKPPPASHVQAFVTAPAPKDPANSSPPKAHVAPPNALRAGPQGPPPQKAPLFHLPNPLGANPPTPPIPILTKHDSHQGHKEHSVIGGAVLAGAVGGAGYATYSHTERHVERYNENYQSGYDARYAPASSPHEQLKGHQEQNYFVSPPLHASYEPGHQRNISHDSQNSTTSHDSEKLAHEYQLDLPDFDNAYGYDRRRSHKHDMEYDFT